MFRTIIITISLFLSACSGMVSNGSSMTTGQKYQPTATTRIEILYDEPKKKFTVIGIVEGRGYGITREIEKERALEGLKKEAAGIGAHAVILTSTGRNELTWVGGESAGSEKLISGKAIRYIDQ